MKFRYIEDGRWCEYRGKKNNIIFSVVPRGNDYYYLLITDLKTNISWNSHARDIFFNTLNEANKFCENVANFYKVKRIKDITKYSEGYYNFNARLDEFLNQ